MNLSSLDIAVAAAHASASVPDDRFQVRSHVRASAPVAPVEVRPTVESFRPAMAPRPEGMSRQVQRAIYRKLCKRAGVDWRREGH